MDDKKEEIKATEEAAKESPPKVEVPRTDDAEDRNPPEAKAEESSEEPSVIDKALLAAGELKKENDRKEVLLKREEKLEADKIASGRGQMVPATTPKKMTDREYSKALMKGELPLKKGELPRQ